MGYFLSINISTNLIANWNIIKIILDLRIHCLLRFFVPFDPIFFLSFRHLVIIKPFYVHKEMVVPKSQNTQQFGRKFFGKPKCATFVEGFPEKF